ncbi:hypothetical protein AP1_0141 [Aeromonas phage AP1]|nr:hypothetical protein AP1_0141 [Aeromonas phage AP1]
MKIRFKDEKASQEFSKRDHSNRQHNHNLVKRYGMNPFDVYVVDSWWDTLDGEFTIHIEYESHYFIIVEE